MTAPPSPTSRARRIGLLLVGGVAAVAAVCLAGRANAIEVPLDYLVLLVPVIAVAARVAVEPAPAARFLALAWYATATVVLFLCLANGKRAAITDYVFVTPLVAAAVVTVAWMTPYRRPAAAPIL
jgi:hypothetical protein